MSSRVVQVTTFASENAAENWRRSAAVRDAYMAGTTQRVLDMAGVGPGSRVLSLGVGTGGEAFDAARRVGPEGRVVATDLSAAMIAVAEAEAARAGLTNMEFRVMDAQQMDFPDGSFDAVTSRNVLMFAPDLRHALSEARRVLRAAGRIGSSVWSTGARNPRIAGPMKVTRELGMEVPPTATYQIALRLGTPAVLRAAFVTAGFTKIHVERVPLIADYASMDEALDRELQLPATQELLALLGPEADSKMRSWLRRRWTRYEDESGVHLPGEQLVVGASA